jgi:hypothetical protein
MPLVFSGTNGVTFPDSSLQAAAASPYVLKNRLINSDMRIDQRNAGASVTQVAGVVYGVDRWYTFGTVTSKFTAQRNAGSVTPPDGFTNYWGITSSSAYTPGTSEQYIIVQAVEGFNVADLGWGNANAQTVTLSFWVRSSLTGTFSGGLQNNDANRSYSFTYSIPVANTWTKISVTISGDTTGTWLTNNGVGMFVNFSMGTGSAFQSTVNTWSVGNFKNVSGAVNLVATNGATFYITGVQLEIGTSATPFERRLYNQELANCQRYYYKLSGASTDRVAIGHNSTTTASISTTVFPTTLRTAPTALEQSGTAAHYNVQHANTSTACSAVPTFLTASVNMATSTFTVASGLTAGQGSNIRLANTSGYLAWSAEL